MGKWLKNHECDVMIASNGKLGLKYLKNKQFDVCFIDFLMVSKSELIFEMLKLTSKYI